MTRIASPVWWLCVLSVILFCTPLMGGNAECDSELTVLFLNLQLEEADSSMIAFSQLDPAWLNEIAALIDGAAADVAGITGVSIPSVVSSLAAKLSAECDYLHLSARTQDLDSSVGFLSTLSVSSAGRTGSAQSYPIPSSTLSCAEGVTSLPANGWVTFNLEELSIALFVVDFVDGPLDCASAVRREAQALLLQQEIRTQAVENGLGVIVMGAFDDYDGLVLDASGNRPISRVLSMLKDVDPATPGRELFNIAELLPQDDRFTVETVSGREQIDFILVSESLRNRVLDASIIRSEVLAHASILLSLAPSLNSEPVAINDTYAVGENQGLTIRAPGVLENDGDADDDPLEAVLVAAPTLGRVTLDADGSFTYIPDFGVSGSDSFVYSVFDGIHNSNVARVSITIRPLAFPRLRITEVEINPAGLDSGREWIEISNPTGATVDLSGWSITDTYHQTVQFIDSGAASIPSNSFYVYSFDQLALANDGDMAIRLISPDGTPVDQTPVLRDSENDSLTWQRFDTGIEAPWDALWVLREATMGKANGSLGGDPIP
ncbi:lamin tail domain-containing protein [Candidatus Bipolaricaulota bacterium]|nr:lamin tail domain-containing protein [Candidatus Bipolaricaulota bacterium]